MTILIFFFIYTLINIPAVMLVWSSPVLPLFSHMCWIITSCLQSDQFSLVNQLYHYDPSIGYESIFAFTWSTRPSINHVLWSKCQFDLENWSYPVWTFELNWLCFVWIWLGENNICASTILSELILRYPVGFTSSMF